MKGLEEYELNSPDPHFRAPVFSTSPLNVHVAPETTIQKRVAEAIGEVVPDERLFTFAAEISNQNLDSYYTRMAESSLCNYARDAAAGVAFLDTHQHNQRLGYSLAGRFEDDGEKSYVIADFYTVRDMQLGSVSTNQFIEALQYGLLRDVSIGFKEAPGFMYRCSACGRDFFSSECSHIPGMMYSVTENPDADPDDQITRDAICFAWIENAALSEVSAVYDGATPDAMIIKAAREQRAGRLKPEVQRMLESAYRIELPKTNKTFRGIEIKNKEIDIMASEATQLSGAPDKMQMKAAAIAARSVGLEVKDDNAVEDTVQTLVDEVRRLKPLESAAIEGRTLRAALIEETLAEGVRAFGDKFDREAKKVWLEKLDAETIGETRHSWSDIGNAVFAGGKRQTKDEPDEPEKDGEGDEDTETPTPTPTEPTADPGADLPEDVSGNV